jgi:hypothetical protein
MFFACATAAQPLWTSFVRRARNASPAHLAAFAGKPTSHPVLIPRKVAGHLRPLPPIPANAEWKGLLLPQIPAYPRSARKRQDRPVTPEVAGSSPVAPVSTSTASPTPSEHATVSDLGVQRCEHCVAAGYTPP